MMDDDKFRLSKSNYICIVILLVSIVWLIVSSILLISSLKEGNKELPNLNITKGRTSTQEVRTTTEPTTTTETTTKLINKDAPYYNVDVNSLYNDELLTRVDINKTEAKDIISILVKYANELMCISDNSLFDIDTTVTYAKEGEADRIVEGNYSYGIIYNGNQVLDKLFTTVGKNKLKRSNYNNVEILKFNGDKIYRVENKLGDTRIDIVSIDLESVFKEEINANITYFKTTYKEDGNSSPVYKKFSVKAIYGDNRWKINDYRYPLYNR